MSHRDASYVGGQWLFAYVCIFVRVLSRNILLRYKLMSTLMHRVLWVMGGCVKASVEERSLSQRGVLFL